MPASKTLKQVFVDTLGLSADVDVEKLKYRSIPEWDSIAHMQLVMEIETAFGVMLPTDDVIALSSFEKAKEILGKHGVTTIA
jgi:acyl carrier protein